MKILENIPAELRGGALYKSLTYVFEVTDPNAYLSFEGPDYEYIGYSDGDLWYCSSSIKEKYDIEIHRIIKQQADKTTSNQLVISFKSIHS